MRAETDLAKLKSLIARDRVREMFTLIKPQLIRYPAIDPASFEAAVLEFCNANP